MKLRHPATVAEKNSALREVLQLISLIGDGVVQELHLNRAAAEMFQVDKEILKARLTKPESPPPQPGAAKPAGKTMTVGEKLLALAVRDREYAEIARKVMPPEAFEDSEFRELASKLYPVVEAGDVDIVALIDSLTDEPLKRRVAAWEFVDFGTPSPKEFERLAGSLRSKWLCRAIAEAEERGDAASKHLVGNTIN